MLLGRLIRLHRESWSAASGHKAKARHSDAAAQAFPALTRSRASCGGLCLRVRRIFQVKEKTRGKSEGTLRFEMHLHGQAGKRRLSRESLNVSHDRTSICLLGVDVLGYARWNARNTRNRQDMIKNNPIFRHKSLLLALSPWRGEEAPVNHHRVTVDRGGRV